MAHFYNRQINFWTTLSCILLMLSMTGCVDLSAAKYRPKKKVAHYNYLSDKKITRYKHPKPYRGEVHTMLGGLGVFSTGMKELSSSVVEECNIPAPSSMWYNAGRVSRKVIASYYKNHRPIILVGHSLGANEQIKVARNLDKVGIPVDLLITVDAVSQTWVPANVKHVMNFYKSGYVPMFSGLRLKAVNPEKTRLDNINVDTLKNVKVNHFTIDKEPVVQAMMMDEIKKVTYDAHRAKS